EVSDSRIVEDEVDPSVLVEYPRRECLDIGGVAHVSADRQGSDLRGSFLKARSFDVGDDDLGAGRDERLRDPATDAGGTARDDRDASREVVEPAHARLLQ